MNSPSAQFVTSRRMTSMIMDADTKLDNQSEDASQGILGPCSKYDQEATKPTDKMQRRLAQNREAARKSRMRKKAYVQQLEQWIGCNPLGFSCTVNSGVAAFEMEYGHWVEEQNRQISELRTALQAHISDIELRFLVDGGMSHYFELFSIEITAAKADVFYSFLRFLCLNCTPLAEQQRLDVTALRNHVSKQRCSFARSCDMIKSWVLYSWYLADHLRRETLQQMSRILTIRQAARGLLALGEYFQRLRALSSLWSTRPREPT
ncbi:hypothetical protein M0R45_005225 [Rubus argutus]|uniref:BZIP domain-containing protein n=1 Tax=Rubus argutus TaxID=59490 RepID=A0AAW1YM15_RUBAR